METLSANFVLVWLICVLVEIFAILSNNCCYYQSCLQVNFEEAVSDYEELKLVV